MRKEIMFLVHFQGETEGYICSTKEEAEEFINEHGPTIKEATIYDLTTARQLYLKIIINE